MPPRLRLQAPLSASMWTGRFMLNAVSFGPRTSLPRWPTMPSRPPTKESPIRIAPATERRSEEHTSELQSLMRNSYAVFCLKKKNNSKEEEGEDGKHIQPRQ